MGTILLLNYPSEGRFALIHTPDNFADTDEVRAWMSKNNWVENIIFESSSEEPFDWWLNFSSEAEG
jgi:hypothetical protein